LTAVFLKKDEDHRIRNGHHWVFSNEIEKIEGSAENGDVVEVKDHIGRPLGYGFYNNHSLIALRLLNSNYTGNIGQYIKECINNAYSLRRAFYPSRNSFRMVYSDSDYLSGLIVDKYNDTYILQVYSQGIHKNISEVVTVLKEEFGAKNILGMNDIYFRSLEGLPETNDNYLGNATEEIIDDGKIKYKIDFNKSQKTGFYFDQCDNREFIERIVKGKTVLDAFCYSGGFGLHAAYAGASSVTFVDSSESAIENARENINLNNVTSECELVKKDVFDYLEECQSNNKKYDVVMADPPAFAKVKKNLRQGIKGYVKLNHLAMSIISDNGFLVSSSCSHHLSEAEFLIAVNKASLKAGRRIQLIHFNRASLDHPSLPAMNETLYLKFAVFRVT
jgi:23S rRNA (cytosine1962-C5)-methyltransferase